MELSNVYYLPFKGSIKKINEGNSIYSDTHSFSQYLSEKIDKDLKMPTIADIKKMVANVQKATGCDETTARNTIAKLSQFASTKSLAAINEQFKTDSIYSVGIDIPELSLTRFFEYVEEKEQIFVNGSDKIAVFLDDKLLDYFAELKKSDPEKYIEQEENIKNSAQLYILHNYNASLDGKKLEYSMFAHSDSLDNIAISVINHRQRTGETLNDISDRRIMKEAKKVFGDDIDVKVIKNLSSTDDADLLYLQQPPRPSVENIECLINLLSKEVEKSGKFNSEYIDSTEIARIVISQYFDAMLNCYSPQSINDAMKKMHSKIIEAAKEFGKTEDDIIYLIPDTTITKSFDLMTYQYMFANDIPPEKVVKERTNSGCISNPLFKDKVTVVLDDFAGSGESILTSKFNYNNFVTSFPSSNVIFAPLVATEYAKSAINKAIFNQIRPDKDKLIFDKMSGYEQFKKNHIHKTEQRDIFNLIRGYEGYDGNNSCSVFPFTEPDNNNNLGHILSGMFLYNPYSSKTPAARIKWGFSARLNDIYDNLAENDSNLLGNLFQYYGD